MLTATTNHCGHISESEYYNYTYIYIYIHIIKSSLYGKSFQQLKEDKNYNLVNSDQHNNYNYYKVHYTKCIIDTYIDGTYIEMNITSTGNNYYVLLKILT